MKTDNLTFIGMAGAGKKHWSEEFAKVGFTPFHCFKEVERNLAPFIPPSIKGPAGIADWLGHPFNSHYGVNEGVYLREECNALLDLLSALQRDDHTYAIAATDSIVYAGHDVCQGLKKLTTVVYIDMPDSMHQKMLEDHFEYPEPLIWFGQYVRDPRADSFEQMMKCFPELCRSRRDLYLEMADIVIPYDEIRAPGFTSIQFLERLGMLC